MEAVWRAITDFGDSALTIPLAVVVILYLLCRRQTALALALATATAGCGVTMALLKLLFGSCSPRLSDGEIVSPSGHVAMSAVVYGCLAVLVVRRSSAWSRTLVAAGTAVLVGGILLSRIILSAHSFPETLVGLAVGTAAAGFFWRHTRPLDPPDLRLGHLAIVCGLVVAATYGVHLPIETVLRSLALSIRDRWPSCG